MWNSPLVGIPSSYQVHRLIPGQETNEASWTLVENAVADTMFYDTAWESLPEGTYKWAVKARYTDQLSIAEFSDELYKEALQPIISVNPTSVSQVMESNSFAEVPITIGNTGSGNLEWNATLTTRHRNSTVQAQISKASGSYRVYSILFSPQSGSIPAGSEDICTLSIDTSDATAGTDLFDLTIYSNDSLNPEYVIPISIEVLPAATNNAPIVSNVHAAQRDDDSMQIDIYYDVYDADGDTLTITMEVSADDGVTWDLSCEEILPGSDIGAGILSGTDRHIVWDAAAEHPNLLYGNNFRFRITADDGVSDMPDGFVLVPGGTFTMGRTTGSGYSDELPTHSVTLNSFYLGTYEVTQAEYAQFMQPGSSWTSNYGLGDNYPAYYVSWYAILKYCNLRSMAEGLTPVYSISGSTNPANWGSVPTSNNSTWNAAICNWNANGYRLPTEAEWEYAARGATNTPDYLYSGSDDINAVAWYSGNNSPNGSKPVGTKAPNGLGLYDMSGNVYEWCWDWYGSSYYSSSPGSNPTGPASGSSRVLRGGFWSIRADYCRVALRNNSSPLISYYSIGFRLCRAVP